MLPLIALLSPPAMAAGHALIVQNKGGGHGEIGYHLARALRAKDLDVTLVQDDKASPAKLPFSRYPADLADCAVVWGNPTDGAVVSNALMGRPPLTHVFDNNAKSPEDCAPYIAAAKASPDFKLFSYVSSAGMYTAKGVLREDMAVKAPPSGQRQVEMCLATQLHGKWTSFRPQYIYGPFTNKRDYIDWFLARAARGLPLPIPGDGSQPVSLTHCEDVAALLASVVGREEAAGGHVFNCGTPETITYNQLCALAGQAVGRPAQVVHLEAGTKTSFPFRPNAEGFYVDVDKACALLGWAPRHRVVDDVGPSGFYTRDFAGLGLAQGPLDTTKDGL